jgi:hypothetical protein
MFYYTLLGSYNTLGHILLHTFIFLLHAPMNLITRSHESYYTLPWFLLHTYYTLPWFLLHSPMILIARSHDFYYTKRIFITQGL